MKAGIVGLGWITPLGAGLDAVHSALCSGAVAETKPAQNPRSPRVRLCRPVPSKLVEHLGRNPRLRRSSPISYFAVAAALAALEHAGLAITPELAAGTAVVFAVSNGSVVYTRRFHEQIVHQGASAASPLLFPETVYNAPASHLAALLGLDGPSYTLVGDNATGLTALHFAAQLLAMNTCERVVVAGGEELDWIVCEAFSDWRLASTPMAEGAGAIVLQREAPVTVQTTAGETYFRRRDCAGALRRCVDHFAPGVDLIVSSANGTFVDRAERPVLGDAGEVLRPKFQLGEALCAGTLWQVILAALAVQKGQARRALVPSIGFNQQAAAVEVSGAA